MAEETTETKPKASKKSPPAKSESFVTKEEFKSLESNVLQALDLITKKLEKPEPHPVFAEKEIEEAKPQMTDAPMNPHWKKAAEEILGDALEDVFVQYPESGGTMFTVVIKKEKSNASQSHWEQHKTDKFAKDRRTKNIGNTGLEGVKKWCELVKANLTRNKYA